MAINVISNTIENIVPTLQRPFTTHNLVERLIANHQTEWNNFVMSYRQANRGIRHQEQIAVTQIGRYIGRNTGKLGIRQGRTLPDNTIIGLIEHNPIKTTEWL